MDKAQEATSVDRILPFEVNELGAAFSALWDEMRKSAERIGRELDLERRLQQNPMAVLGVVAGAGFVLGGGLWPVLRPFAKAAIRSALSPANLVAAAAALGASRAAAREEWGEDGQGAG